MIFLAVLMAAVDVVAAVLALGWPIRLLDWLFDWAQVF